jgi:hypothetical protein
MGCQLTCYQIKVILNGRSKVIVKRYLRRHDTLDYDFHKWSVYKITASICIPNCDRVSTHGIIMLFYNQDDIIEYP